MSDSEMIEELVTQLLDMYSEGLLDDFDQEKFEQMIEGLLEAYELSTLIEFQPGATTQAQSVNNGSGVTKEYRIKKTEATCTENWPVAGYIGCTYGVVIDYIHSDAPEDVRYIGKVEYYLGGSFDSEGNYLYDGEFIDKDNWIWDHNPNSEIFKETIVTVSEDGSIISCIVVDKETETVDFTHYIYECEK